MNHDKHNKRYHHGYILLFCSRTYILILNSALRFLAEDSRFPTEHTGCIGLDISTASLEQPYSLLPISGGPVRGLLVAPVNCSHTTPVHLPIKNQAVSTA